MALDKKQFPMWLIRKTSCLLSGVFTSVPSDQAEQPPDRGLNQARVGAAGEME